MFSQPATCLVLEEPSKYGEALGTSIKYRVKCFFLLQGFIRLDMSEFQERHEVSKWAIAASKGRGFAVNG